MNYSKVIKPALLFLAILFAFSLWQRVPDIDDAWIGEHAYWLEQKGYVKSELMHGITNQHERHIVHHKLFTLCGLAFIKMFGFSLYSLKSVSLLWSMIFALIFFFYVRKENDSKMAWFGLLFMAVNSFIFQYSFVFRPEIMVMTLGFLSFICLEKYLKENSTWLLILSGFIAGLSATAHLNGMIFIGAGSLVLLWKKKPIPAIILGLASLPGLAVYFYDFTSQYNFAYWYYQVNDSPALHESSVMPSSVVYFLKIIREHLRFFHSPKEIIMSLLLLFSILTNFKDLKNKTIYLHYLVLLIVLLSLISVHTTSKYLLLYMPFIALIILRSLTSLYRSLDKSLIKLKMNHFTRVKVAGTLLLLYFGIHFTYDIIISMQKYDTDKNIAITSKYFTNNVQKMNIVAPMDFIFNELPKYGRIQSDLSIEEMQKHSKTKDANFFTLIDLLKIDGIILTEEYVKKFGIEIMNERELKIAGFDIVGKENGYTFLRRINAPNISHIETVH